MVETQFSGPEVWAEISDFPKYEVSNWGRVRRTETDTIVTPTRKVSGMMMVGLMRDRIQHKRSLTLLVAQAFVPPHPNEAFDTPINLNGDRSDNMAYNIMWRPLWFARKYNLQFTTPHATYDDPIEDVETHIVYKDSYSASVEHGILEQEIVISMTNNTYVWPTGQIFRAAI